MNDLQALELLIKMKQYGITQDELDGFKNKFKTPEPILNADEVSAKLFHEELTDEEILYYATPYGLELEAQKELKNKQMKEERQ